MQRVYRGGLSGSGASRSGGPPVFLLLALSLGSTLLVASCSARIAALDGPPDGGGAPSSDAAIPSAIPPGAAVDASDGSSCVPAPVWAQGATGFTLTSIGGDILPPPVCNAIYENWDFALASKTLTYVACEAPAPSNISLLLTDGEVSRIVTSMQGLTTDCPPCCGGGADAPEMVLTVASTQGPPMVYSGDFYVSLGRPPYIGTWSLGLLSSVLDDILTSACSPDGGEEDAGRCVQAAFDAGAD
jgi:hypothetical protein